MVVLMSTVLMLLTFNLHGSAAVIDSWGVGFGTPEYVSSRDEYVIKVSYYDANSIVLEQYDVNFNSLINTQEMSLKSSTTNLVTSCNGGYISKFYKNGEHVGYLKYTATSINSEGAQCGNDSTPDPPDSGGGGDGGGSGCIGCDLFNCPGWSQHMGKLDEIKNAIPPAPNWQQVANTFRDTIAPKIKADLEDVLGRAPTPPAAPKAPARPSLPGDLNDGGLKAPTGKEAPGLDDAGFTGKDIKDKAPTIEEREDPTGGFTINDPISGLPSQDEFKDNIPDEGSATLPGDPEELENKAPTPPEKENAAPNPSEKDNTAPTPSEGSNAAPKPEEGKNTAPKPSEGSNTAPTPGSGSYDKPPIPGSEGATAPTPGNTGGSAPVPNESGKAPVPKGDSSRAPIPGG